MTAPDSAARLTNRLPLSKLRLRLWLRLLKTSGMIEDEVRRRLRTEFATTLPRFDVMSALSRHPDGLKMSEISVLLRVSNGNVTGIVDKLAKEGLALRLAVPQDRRASLVRLTPKGLAVFAQQAAAHEKWMDTLLAGFGVDDIDGMTVRLDRLIRTLEEKG
jgi:DNA-binding MarR family transcriptional regulator